MIDLPVIEAAEERWEVDSAIVCTGDDFLTLYPQTFAASGIRRCRLQMMRTAPQPDGWELGPALAARPRRCFCSAFGRFDGRRMAPVILVALVGFLMIGPYSYLAGAIALDFGGKQGTTASGLIDGAGYPGEVLAGNSFASVTVIRG